MIESGDKIAVGLSGGKDSLALLYALKHIQKFYPKSFDLCAITVDLGFGNFNLEAAQEFCSSLCVPYTIVPIEISQVVFETRKESNPVRSVRK
ncbi:Predicted ATPase of the PP-loop superfamily implicated in cell cycle control [butyrate-producing bacterium SM4/1]|nr:Predicted ATPase of the PP-loop superfamily implicated in cell cycle control [butyrate-producing bacterium SM4/1]